MVELIDEPHATIAQTRARFRIQRSNQRAVDAHLAGVRVSQTAENVQQRAFARPGTAEDRYAFAARDVQFDAAQYRQQRGPLMKRLHQRVAFERGCFTHV